MMPENIQNVRENAERVSSLMKTLSHPNRLMIVCDLMGAEKAVSDIEASSGVRQPVLSRELARLRDEGLVATRRESKAVFYHLTDPDLIRLMDILCHVWTDGSVNRSPLAGNHVALARPEAGGASLIRNRVRLKPDPYRTQ